MTTAQIVELAQHKAKVDREVWLTLLGDAQEFSVERVTQRTMDWARLGTAAHTAAEIFADIERIDALQNAA